MPKEEGGQRSEAGASRGLRQAGGSRCGAEGLASGRRWRTKRTSKQVRVEAVQHCCCPDSSLASKYVKYNESIVIKLYLSSL